MKFKLEKRFSPKRNLKIASNMREKGINFDSLTQNERDKVKENICDYCGKKLHAPKYIHYYDNIFYQIQVFCSNNCKKKFLSDLKEGKGDIEESPRWKTVLSKKK
jgi:hypothetical protein